MKMVNPLSQPGMCLTNGSCNGSEGIGTGWSSYIPNYNPRDIVANVRRLLNGEQMEPMHPWYRGFKGTIEKTASKEAGVTYTVTGIMEEVDEITVRIMELPIRRWTQDYKDFLDSIITGNDPFIKEFRQYGDDTTVEFEVTLTEENMVMAKQEGLLKKFKLTTTISTSNMHLFDLKGMMKKYDTPEEILEEFFHLRFEFYEKRKKLMLDNLEMELLKLENKVRFILGVVKGEIIVNNRKRADLFLELQEKGFTPFPKKSKTVEVAAAGATDDTEETEENSEVSAKGVRGSDYDYLLSMAIGSLTLEKVHELCSDRNKLQQDVEDLRKATPKSLWLKDLDDLEMQLDEQDKAAQAEEAGKVVKGKPKGEAGKRAQRQGPKNPRKINNKDNKAQAVTESSEISFSSAMETEKVPAVVKPKGRGGSNKAKKDDSDDDEDFDIPALRARLAKHNINSSPDHSDAMEIEVPQEPAGKKEPSKRAVAAKKKPVVSLSEISESIGEFDINDEDLEVVAAPEAGKKGRRNPAANSKAAKPPAVAKKRGPKAQQKLLTEMLKPAAEDSGISPEKKVRKKRASPFNKKSSSILGRVGKELEITTDSEETPGSSSSMCINNTEEVTEVIQPRSRPQRANRQQTTYVVGDSETENATDDSDFEEDED